MISCLFWNLRGLPRADLVARMCVEHGVNLLMLAECGIEPAGMIAALSAAGLTGFVYPLRPTGIETGLRVFLRAATVTMVDVEDDANAHVTVRHLFGAETDVLLVVVHLPSKLHAARDTERLTLCRYLADLIRKVEARVGHDRTVLVGDLNMNPFETGVVSADALHGVPTRSIVGRGRRTVNAREWDFFYNPMWRFFGERPDEPPGTYYYAASGRPTSYFWNIFDQVLVRPSIMGRLTSVRILDRVGARSLVRAVGTPDPGIGFDHLPIVFTLDLGEVT